MKPAKKTTNLKIVRAAQKPEKQTDEVNSQVPIEGPGSLKEFLYYLENVMSECMHRDCIDTDACEHKFSLNHGWELMCRLQWLSDEEFAKHPASAQRIVKTIKIADKRLKQTLDKIAPFLPKQKNGRHRLIFEAEERFIELRAAQLHFCVAGAYVAGTRAQDRELNRFARWIANNARKVEKSLTRPEYSKAYLDGDWIIQDLAKQKATIESKNAANGDRKLA
jgi:hypothetical protein